MGAEGIGLARTERMFNAEERLPHRRLHDHGLDRGGEEVLPRQAPASPEAGLQEDTEGDARPPGHHQAPRPTAPRVPAEARGHARARSRSSSSTATRSSSMQAKRMLDKARQLSEANPMLGHRGVRLGLTHPEIYEMQITAVMEATAELVKEGVNVKPKIMIPQVAAPPGGQAGQGAVRAGQAPRGDEGERQARREVRHDDRDGAGPRSTPTR